MNSSCLVIKNDGMGDLVACSGLIAGLAEHFSGRLDLVTWDQNREVADRIDGVRRVLSVSPNGMRFRNRPQRLGVLWPVVDPPSKAAAAAIRETRYDVAICLRRYIRLTAFVCMKLVRAHKKVAFWQMPTNLSRPLAERLSQGWEHWQGDETILSEITYYREVLKRSLNIELDAKPRLKFTQSSFEGPTFTEGRAVHWRRRVSVAECLVDRAGRTAPSRRLGIDSLRRFRLRRTGRNA